MTDFYSLLGVPKTASKEEIKKAYKRQALKWHPDKHINDQEAATEKFKQISEAFQVLNDDEKRRIYDQFGEEGLKRGGGVAGPEGMHFNFGSGGFMDAHDLFANMFSGMGMGGLGGLFGMGGRKRRGDFSGGFGGPSQAEFDNLWASGVRQQGPTQDPPIYHDLGFTLDELYTGITRRVAVTRAVFDEHGNRQREEKDTLVVEARPGWKPGTKVTFPQRGDVRPGRIPADIVFVVKQRPHPVLSRDGNDLICPVEVSLSEALVGFQRSLPLLAGRATAITITDISSHGRRIVQRGLGMPISKRPGQCGDLIIMISVRMPTSLTHEEKVALAQILHNK